MGYPWVVVFVGVVLIAYAIYYLIVYGSKQTISSQQLQPKLPQPQFVNLGTPDPRESWSLKSIVKEFNLTKHGIKDINQPQIHPEKKECLKSYFSYLVVAWKLTLREKEIITFALLQLVSIAIGYYLWVQMLGWIPPEVWRTAAQSKHASWPDLILLAWSFVCVGVAALPLSVFSACIGVVYFLRRQGYPSTIAACLKIVLPAVWSLWVFQWMDGWITVNQILERLPKKGGRGSPANIAISEALYFAWKLGTIGIMPAVITGRGLVESCRDSIVIIKTKFIGAAKLRLGYSLLCWIVGISVYIGTIFFFIYGHFIPPHAEIYGFVYTFYFWAGIPVLVAVALIALFLRPAYIVGSCELYAQHLTENNKTIMLPQPPAKSISAFVFFIILCILIGVVFLYRGPLGINAILSVPYK